MCRLNRLKCRDKLYNPRNYVNVFTITFREVLKNKQEIEIGKDYSIWKKDYWDFTEEIIMDVKIGRDRLQNKFSDFYLINKYRDKYNLSKEVKVIYTHLKSKGVGM